ncbi:hypothetical protein V2P57_02990 [Mycoplasma mycoides subsp. mycoides]|uniref:hypothetical protein n=1 Tax=Mycoplasma mycoides TaxID=2102 RepID=UPI0001DD7AE7|nr:hypothetical protein [Mycoplasma mycoides]ADK69507.1 conserved hypothetical protein [Mycoplasma mycoides subsp. mycoides SC str. Gladysdale]AIZ55447.1 hypothetical protein mycmycITA_00624 [Mycoplasma mycoides subsp. mycoides]AME10797.1 hypothetical protein MmmBen_0635 [Mycoplasma mycoides subsp. mycoides]AME11804.1 hypothetical protein MmmBen50_0621 [Mycoplasma mycoides subsp. mycoides]AME12833.1 hypothetical protein MmmBen181_0673 [Mycoplasma mycoides subsp. mycoides]
MDKQIFTIIEFNRNIINFQVIKYFNNQEMILYKNSYISEESEILDKDQIKDSLNVYKFLTNCFTDFEKNSSFSKIKQIGLMLSNSLNITKKVTNYGLKSKDKKTSSTTNLEYIVKKINKLQLYDDTDLKIIDTNLIELQVNNKMIDYQNLKKYYIDNTQNNKLVMTFLELSITNELYFALEKLFWKFYKQILFIKPRIVCLNQLVKDQCQDHKLVVDWNWDEIEVGVFNNNALLKIFKFSFGINKIIKNLSQSLNISFEMSKDYLFNNLDFSSYNINNLNVLSLWNNSENKLDTTNGKQIKQLIKSIISEIYITINQSILKEQNINNYQIYNFGLISKIVGIDMIFNELKNNHFISNNFIGDIDFEQDSTAFIGASLFFKNPEFPSQNQKFSNFFKAFLINSKKHY